MNEDINSLKMKNAELIEALNWITETSLRILREEPVRNFDEILAYISSLAGKKYI